MSAETSATPSTLTEIQRADPRLRRSAVVVMILATLAAIALVFWLQRRLVLHADTLTTDEFVAQMRSWLAVVVSMIAACLLLLGGHAARSARGIARQQRWPLSGARVLRDTPVRHGAAALRFARWLKLAAVVLLALAVCAGLVGWRLFVMTR